MLLPYANRVWGAMGAMQESAAAVAQHIYVPVSFSRVFQVVAQAGSVGDNRIDCVLSRAYCFQTSCCGRFDATISWLSAADYLKT